MSPTAYVLCYICKVNPPSLPEYDQVCDHCREARSKRWAEEEAAARERPARPLPAHDRPRCDRCQFMPIGPGIGLKCKHCGYVTDKKREFGW